MSLINQMLKDLDARHDADARARLHREVFWLPLAWAAPCAEAAAPDGRQAAQVSFAREGARILAIEAQT